MSRRPDRVPGRFPLLLTAGWLLVAYAVAPLVVRLSGGAAGDLLYPWFSFAAWPAVAGLSFAAYSALAARRGVVADDVLGATATSLAGVRIAVCAVALLMVLREPLASAAALPAALRRADGLLAALLRLPVTGAPLDAVLTSSTGLAFLQGSAIVLLGSALVGWRTRWTLPASAVAYLLVQAVPRLYSRDYHSGLVPLYLLIVLACSPCADALSLDRRRRGGGPPAEEPRAVYGWSRWACWTVMAATYFLAGLSKLRSGGLDWVRGDNLRAFVMQDWLQPMSVDLGAGRWLLHAPTALFAVLGVASLLFELAYPAVLVSRRARRWLPAMAVGFHLGVLGLLNIAFPDMPLLQVIFYDVRRWLPGRRGSAAPAAPAGDDVETARRAPGSRAARALAAAWLFAWVVGAETYPLTTLPMYEEDLGKGAVVYDRVWRREADGTLTEARIAARLPLLTDGRWRAPLAGIFFAGPARRRGEALLRAAAEASPPAAYRVERFTWDLDADPGGRLREGPEDGRGGRLPGRRTAIVELQVGSAGAGGKPGAAGRTEAR